MAFEGCAAQLQATGWEVRRLRVMDDIEAINHRHRRLIAGEMAQSHLAWFPKYESLYRPRTAELIRTGLGVSATELAEARSARQALREALHAAMDSSGIDAWICPSATGPAPAGIESTGPPSMQLPWTHAGLPVATIPAGAIGDLPLGMQLVGRFDADAPLAALAAELAQASRAERDAAPR
jgi:Asp-tRNA(Asn)/Glu-tRNA(Gln) amidotransferase A subunit family amidase